MASKLYKYPMMVIEWKDAHTSSGWEEIKDIDHALPVAISVGFLLEETEDAFVLVNTYSTDAINNMIAVPKGMIVKKTVIRKGNDDS